MRLIKFLSLLEKIIIVLIILCFVPIVLFAYLPQRIAISHEMENAFSEIKKQSNYEGFLTDMNANSTCNSIQMLALTNERCMERCLIGQNCFILASTSPCPLPNSYRLNSTQICSAKPVLNEKKPVNTIEFQLNSQLLPLSSITMSPNQSLVYSPYCISDKLQCQELVSQFSFNLQQSFSDNYQTFSAVVNYLMYFGLIPLIVHTILVLVLDSCCNFNLRLTNSLMIIHESLTGTGVIIAGIMFNFKNDELASRVTQFPKNCLISISECQYLASPFANFTANDGISSIFVTAMCFILVIEVLLLIGVVAINFLMVKYYKLREIDPSLSGYELQIL